MSVKKFRFEGIAKDGKILSGFLFSENKDTARAKLTEQGLAILTLEPYMQQEVVADGLSIFEFKALTAKGEEIRGNIEAKTLYAAYKKIRTEYNNYKLLYLIPQAIPFEQKEELKKQGLDPQLEELFQEDQRTQKTRKVEPKEKSKREQKNDKVISIIEEKQEMMKFFQKEIDFVIEKVQILIRDNEKYLDPSRRRDIQDSLNTLARLRQSNAVEHLEGVLRKVFAKLLDPKIFLPIHDNIPDFFERELAFQKLSKDLEDRLDHGLAKVDIGTINTEAIKTTVQDWHIPQKTGRTFYWTNVFLFMMMLCFWFLNVLRLFFDWGVEKVQFYFTSPSFWFATGFTGLITLVFAIEIFSPQPFSWFKRGILYSVAFVLAALFVLEFPVLFFWT